MNTAEKLRKMAEFDPLRRAILTDAADELDALTAQLQAAQAQLAAIRSIGAHSGTDLNAWNKAFDVLDDADMSAHDAAIMAAKAGALRDAADAAGEAWVHGSWNLTMDTGQWLRDRAASIEQTEANRG